MGFDLFIHHKLMMCDITGKPYYFGENLEKVYEFPEFKLPEKLVEYLQGRGRFFHAYTDRFEEAGVGFEVDVCEFLDQFPDWEEVQGHEQYDEFWTKEDHENFKELLECLESLPCPFSVSWSY